jgi:ATP-dependent DNA ligase
MAKTFPTLYKLTGTGEVQEWTIEVVDNAIYTMFGRHGGKIQRSAPDVIKEGKNTGKKNERDPQMQALSEAQSEWEKKLKKGYVKTIEEAKAGAVSDLVEGGVWPMLAKRYDKDGEKIVWPAFAQPKLDGHRCIAMVDAKGKCVLWSRTRKPITGVPHIVEAIEALGIANVNIDGELYNHAYHDKFEELSSFIRQQEPKPGHEVVQFHIYDLAIENHPFSNRIARLAQLVPESTVLRPVETIPVADEDELMAAFEHYREEGYEGCMVRNAKGIYEGHPTHRSSDLQKVKEFDDAEFKVVNVIEGRGKLAGHGIFICETDKGAQFEAKMIGKLENLKQYLANPQLAIGRMLTVQFQGMTKKAGVPRFPVALRFREEI